MKDIVRVNLEEAQRLQKKAYEQRTQEHSFKEGDSGIIANFYSQADCTMARTI